MKRQRLFSTFCLLLVLTLLILLVYTRTQLVDRYIGSYIACAGCFNSSVVMADLVMFSIASGILLVAGLIRPAWLARIVQLLLGVVILVYVTDLVVFDLFHSRLFLSDASLFVTERAAVWDQFYTGVGGAGRALALLGGVLLLFVLLAVMPPARTRSHRLLLTAVLAAPLIAGIATKTKPYVNQWAVDNVFSANLATTERVRYSEANAAAMLATRQQPTVFSSVTGGGDEHRNVILVILESWSSWHSKLFGGFEDWTPNLDRAAARGLRFTRFHSIGFSTDKGLMGILGGLQIWSPFLHPFEASPFHSAWGLERTLPSIFSDRGYRTAFLTTGPLDLYRKGEWLRDLGFGHVEGNENPFYEHMPRFAFNSASDSALYARARQWQAQAQTPWLLVLETVSTHQPYKDPVTGKRSLEKAMKYADQAFGDFMLELDRSGYFTDGILIVASDHRSMTPIPLGELETFGPDAHSQVPAFIVGAGFGAGTADDRVCSQADLVPSLEFWLNGSARLGALQSLMWNAPPGHPETAAPNCAFHSRGDLRGLVEVICNTGRGQVRLDGDRTRFTHFEGLNPADREQVLRTLAVLRLEGWQRHEARLTASRR